MSFDPFLAEELINFRTYAYLCKLDDNEYKVLGTYKSHTIDKGAVD